MGFPRQEYWSGLSFPSPGDLPHLGVEPRLLHWKAGSLPLRHLEENSAYCGIAPKIASEPGRNCRKGHMSENTWVTRSQPLGLHRLLGTITYPLEPPAKPPPPHATLDKCPSLSGAQLGLSGCPGLLKSYPGASRRLKGPGQGMLGK